jgi:hypothetical protein
MIGLAKKVARRVRAEWKQSVERRRLSPLYSPDRSNLDLDAHLTSALDWLKRAQDAGADRGVSYGVAFGQDFDASYPETTGYVCQTFVEQEQLTGDADLLTRAIEMGDWEISIQMPEGAVMGGVFNTNPTPAVFNTGMVLLGWSALIRRTGETRFKEAARRASDWLLSVQEPDGNWIRGNSQFAASESTLYNVKAAWGLCEAGLALDDDRYVHAATRNAEHCLAHQTANGWFPNCCLSDKERPLLHTVAYTMQGLVNIGKLTGRQDFIAGARKTADAEIQIMRPDGFLPGRQNSQFHGTVDWCCLTGSAQTSLVWSSFYDLTGEEKYRKAADSVNGYLMARHDIRNTDVRLRGGVPGAWPVWGGYGRLTILNWATKYLVDALSAQKYSEATPVSDV